VATCNLFDGPRKTGTIGLPLPGTRVEIRSAEAPGKPVALGERGEICIHGPQVMAGYLDRPDATDRALIDGWLHTGDIGYMDGDGFVFLVDRIKDVIVRDGYKVYPRIVEDTILGHPEVAEVIVIGVPDAQRGAFPKAFVRPESAAALDGAALRAYLVSRLSPVEIPREFEFRSHLPRTLVGKPDKQALLAEELARLSGDATAG
jgi:long-chain acyl-CoA synthetase